MAIEKAEFIDVAAAVLRKDVFVLVAKRARGQHLEYKWEFPGGKIEENETPEECLRRELKEEFGITVEVGEYIGESVFNYPDKNVRLLAYNVNVISGNFSLTVHEKISWVKINDLAMIDLAAADITISLILQEQINVQRDGNLDYYESHFQDYHERTFNIDSAYFLAPLTKKLPKGASVLDVGCGSGRDIFWLKTKGYVPTGFERSAPLAELARQHSGCPVIVGDFSCYDFPSLKFDSVVIVGALVHLQHAELPPVLNRICSALKSGGLLFLSVKEGDGEFHSKDGRIFTLWRREPLENIFRDQKLTVIDFARNISAVNRNDVWLSYLLVNEGTI
ncbi:MAG: NUDIX domain-containing protein [Pseudomonadota bacterium]